MSITTIFIYLFYSALLFIILEYINNKYNINKLNNIIISIIYLLLISGLFPKHTTNIFIVIILSILIKIFYYNNILEKHYLKHNNIKIDIITILLSYILNISFINKVDNVFPNPSELKIIIWFSIIIYISNLLKNNINNSVNINKEKQDNYKDEYIVMEYAKNKNKYSNIINPKNKELIPIIYSIMIYENYHRAFLLRKIDNYIFKITNKECKLGIMQINSSEFLTDEESIDLCIKKLDNIYSKLKNKEDLSKLTLKKYLNNDDKYKSIINIYNKIIEFDKK